MKNSRRTFFGDKKTVCLTPNLTHIYVKTVRDMFFNAKNLHILFVKDWKRNVSMSLKVKSTPKTNDINGIHYAGQEH
jgi:hypothetical protein